MRTPSALKIHGGVKQSMPRTGSSNSKISSKATRTGILWREHCADDPFGNITKHVADSYEVRTRELFLVPLYALFVFRSPLHGGKKQNTQLHCVGVNRLFFTVVCLVT